MLYTPKKCLELTYQKFLEIGIGGKWTDGNQENFTLFIVYASILFEYLW